VAVACVASAGCKSDLSQQLLERELRYQEDQIYQLQDELQEQCSRLEQSASENASLRRQLGLAPGDQATPRTGPVRPRPPAGAAPVPPAIQLPDGPGRQPAGPPLKPAPPDLEGVPPLPTGDAGRSTTVPAGGGLDFPPGPAPIDPAARPFETTAGGATGRRTSFDVPVPEGPPARVVVNLAQTACIADAGTAAGLRLVFEVRDDEERLVAAAGDVTSTVFDAADAGPVARWEIPAAQAAGHFRRTSRARGLHFDLPWQGRGPTADTVRVVVGFVPPGGPPLETEATIRTR
ncbi:MAG: hypothetical protein ACK5SI_03350, partial [Planctomycetia bacterium]